MKLVGDLSVTSYRRRRRTGPALSLDFERQEYRRAGASVSLNAVLTFARASGAVQVGADGVLETVAADELRRDHVFGTGAFRGALFEAGATNLLRYSGDFTQSYWNGYALKPAFTGGQAAPDGTGTALRWNCADTQGGAGGRRGGILVPGPQHAGVATASVWLRASAPVNMRFGHSDATSGVISVTPAWRRFSYTGVLPNSQNRIFMLYEDVNDIVDVDIWGAQVELGDRATSNIATAGSAASRAADAPGLRGLSGVFDVRVTYDDDSQDILNAQSVGEGWWPALSRPHVKSIVLD